MSDERTEPCGALLLDKPEHFTSFDAVACMRKLFGLRRVGHAGTLDPMATGLLVVLVGRAAKAAEFFCEGTKRYEARFRLGVVSDTEDIWGTVEATGAPIPVEDAVRACVAGFLGDSEQLPPMYSAIKKDGQKLVDLARRGITVERERRPIHVESLTLSRLSDTDYAMNVVCSKGTYIRTLCADIGAKLGCGAVMTALRRTDIGTLSLSDTRAVTIDALRAMTPEECLASLIPTEDAFPDLARVTLPAFFAALAKSGNEIYQKKIETDYPVGARVLLFDGDGFFAFAEVCEYPDGTALKPIRRIRL